jgi:hypothetical protein
MTCQTSSQSIDVDPDPGAPASKDPHDNAGTSAEASAGPRARGSITEGRPSSASPGCGCGSCATAAGAAGFGKDGPAGGGATTAAGGGAAPAAGPRGEVSIFAVNVGASTRDAEPDIARANPVWSPCGVGVNSAGSRGEAFIPSINHTSALIISDAAAASDTMAHELGHILLDQPNHDPDPDNVLAAGAIRHVGVDHVSAAQCARL